MFSTFTGNSRRPRNVNLSGGAGNPFANTSWSPSVASNTTKTISDAQADRERRQAERQRLKAAGTIQRSWRGHKDRTLVANRRRAVFDELYKSNTISGDSQKLQTAFGLLLGFYRSNNSDDVERLFRYAADTRAIDVQQLYPSNISASRLQRFVRLLTASLQTGFATNEYGPIPSHHDPNAAQTDQNHSIRTEQRQVLELILRIISQSPDSLSDSTTSLFMALSSLAQNSEAAEWRDLLFTAIASTLAVPSVDSM